MPARQLFFSIVILFSLASVSSLATPAPTPGVPGGFSFKFCKAAANAVVAGCQMLQTLAWLPSITDCDKFGDTFLDACIKGEVGISPVVDEGADSGVVETAPTTEIYPETGGDSLP